MTLPWRVAGWVAAIAAGPLLLRIVPEVPFMNSTHLVFSATAALAATGLTLIMGFAGQVSLGHAAFYGIGAYTTAILTVDHGVAPLLAMGVGMLLAAGTAVVVARAVFRAQEHFLAMATLAFGLIFYFFLQYARALTGGNSGRGGIPRLALGGFEVTTASRMFLFTWLVLIAGIVLARNVTRSRTGRALRAMGASQVAAACCGINLVRAKVSVFALGGAYAAAAGSLYAHHVTYVSPDEFGLLTSIEFLIIVIVGGLTSVWGALVGAFVLSILTEAGREVVPVFVAGATGPYELVIFGLILVIVLVFFPRGIAGSMADVWWKRVRATEGSAPPAAPAEAAAPRRADVGESGP